MGRRGSFFSLDAIIAIFIVIAGIYIFFSSNSKPFDIDRAQIIGNQVLDFMDQIQVKDVCNGTYSDPPEDCQCIYESVESLYCHDPPYIKNSEQTLLEVIGELYSRGNSEGIRDIINRTVELSGIVPENFDFYIYIDHISGNNHVKSELFPNNHP